MIYWKPAIPAVFDRGTARTRRLAWSFVVALLASSAVPATAAPAYPLQKSSNGRYFVDQAGIPVLVHGDTPWSLIGELTREEATEYLDDCAARKFNSLIVNVPEAAYTSNPPHNAYGQPPFLTAGRFNTVNDAYFQHADWVVQEAAARGIQIFMAPAYLGHPGEGWYDYVRYDNTEQQMRDYGAWVGNRYKNTPNLMFHWGNEPLPFDAVIRDKVRAMAEGLRSVDASHLTTYHSSSEQATYDVWNVPQEGWVDFNNIYTYSPVWESAERDYGFSPATPFVLLESHYENEHGTNGKSQRVQAYHALLSGAAGHFYGNSPIWHMGVNGGDWRAALSDPGRDDMTHVRDLFESRAWYRLVPDFAQTVLIAGHSIDDDRATAALTDDGATLIVYAPSQRALRVDLDALSGSNATAWWFNPRSGTVDTGTQVASSGTRDFNPPTQDDWVLVIDDTAAALPPPGSAPIDPEPDPGCGTGAASGGGTGGSGGLPGYTPQFRCSASSSTQKPATLYLFLMLGAWVVLRRKRECG